MRRVRNRQHPKISFLQLFSSRRLKIFRRRDLKSLFCLHTLGHPVILYTFKRASYFPAGGPMRNPRALEVLLKEGGADPNVMIQGRPLLIVLCDNSATRVRWIEKRKF
jgi:hypothetical protein